MGDHKSYKIMPDFQDDRNDFFTELGPYWFNVGEEIGEFWHIRNDMEPKEYNVNYILDTSVIHFVDYDNLYVYDEEVALYDIVLMSGFSAYRS